MYDKDTLDNILKYVHRGMETVTIDMLEGVMKATDEEISKLEGKIELLERRVRELNNMFHRLSTPAVSEPEKNMCVGEDNEEEASLRTRHCRSCMFPPVYSMTDKELAEVKEGLYEDTYYRFKLTYPGMKPLMENITGLRKYTQYANGRIWKGVIEYWREYELYVMENKPEKEYGGAIKRPQYRTR